jgi:hypothetical protein
VRDFSLAQIVALGKSHPLPLTSRDDSLRIVTSKSLLTTMPKTTGLSLDLHEMTKHRHIIHMSPQGACAYLPWVMAKILGDGETLSAPFLAVHAIHRYCSPYALPAHFMARVRKKMATIQFHGENQRDLTSSPAEWYHLQRNSLEYRL